MRIRNRKGKAFQWARARAFPYVSAPDYRSASKIGLAVAAALAVAPPRAVAADSADNPAQ